MEAPASASASASASEISVPSPWTFDLLISAFLQALHSHRRASSKFLLLLLLICSYSCLSFHGNLVHFFLLYIGVIRQGRFLSTFSLFFCRIEMPRFFSLFSWKIYIRPHCTLYFHANSMFSFFPQKCRASFTIIASIKSPFVHVFSFSSWKWYVKACFISFFSWKW